LFGRPLFADCDFSPGFAVVASSTWWQQSSNI